jgi:hypothetical protein
MFFIFPPSYRHFLFFIEPQVCALQSHIKGGFAGVGVRGGYSFYHFHVFNYKCMCVGYEHKLS